MELILVRHGQPAWVTPDGRNTNDPELTALGHEQAKRVAARLADTEDLPGRGDVDRLYVSPAIRAQQTAAPIRDALGIEASTHDWLVELQSPSAWEGAPIEEVQQAFATLGADASAVVGRPPRRRVALAFHRHVTTGVRGLLADLGVVPTGDPGLWDLRGPAGDGSVDRIVAVAHGGTNSAIIAHLLGARPRTVGVGSLLDGATPRSRFWPPWRWPATTSGRCALGGANHLLVADRTS
ncbi:MAG: histidine phosphatase family protein [Acidimicrobiales bacterium]